MRVGDHMHELACLEPRDLREHMSEHGVLHDIPVICREHILRALIEYGVEGVSADVEGHGVRAGIQRHFAQVCVVIDIGHYAARGGVVLKIPNYLIDLIHIALGIVVLNAELIAVGLADGAVFVRPGIPDARAQLVYIVALCLPYPQKLVDSRLPERSAYRQYGKLLGKIVAVHDAEFFHRVRRSAVGPSRAHLKLGIPHAVSKYILAVCYKYLVSSAHIAPHI